METYRKLASFPASPGKHFTVNFSRIKNLECEDTGKQLWHTSALVVHCNRRWAFNVESKSVEENVCILLSKVTQEHVKKIWPKHRDFILKLSQDQYQQAN